jgi:hypothetical protein
MPSPVSESIELKLFDRFDARTGQLSAKIGAMGICLQGPFEPGAKYALFLNKAGNLFAMQEDPQNGLELKRSGKSAKKFCCSRLVRAMIERGADIPQTVDFELKDGVYTARLKMVQENDLPNYSPPRKKYGPRKPKEN